MREVPGTDFLGDLIGDQAVKPLRRNGFEIELQVGSCGLMDGPIDDTRVGETGCKSTEAMQKRLSDQASCACSFMTDATLAVEWLLPVCLPKAVRGLRTSRQPAIGDSRYLSKDCSMTAVHLYLSDHKASTINRVISAVQAFEKTHTLEGVSIKLAAGNAGVLAATNDEVEKSETPMMMYVYGAIILLVFFVYRDLRAVVACCLPLTVGTFAGYWFMKEFQIGLTVATLPVMVLAVGIGVDYAFYIYNRLQLHLANGEPITKALEHSMLEVGMATVFTAITLAIGVATWSFSALKFQADMGKLLTFMFMVNLIMAMTALPALAVVLEIIFPRRRPVRAPGVLSH